MYLKSIEVHGFKSFADKIVFDFHNGITGIVGPNGSGKSNVADAVRWVLGEQRIKQLRGASMQDVIFSGTEARKPLSYAYVAITFDNADHKLSVDFNEVTVARRIYRSGESEYLINGNPCRLKDVNNLFYDTGIGKEGYSIIGQGQIDRIISGRPEERRELFDEAAGIVKFKKNKALSQQKLENEKQNLVRVNDILAELEKQVEPLEKQSEKAKIYLSKKADLKTLDVNVFLLENKSMKDRLSEVTEKHAIAAKDFESVNERYNGIKDEYEAVQAEIEELERSIEEQRQTLSNAGIIRGKLEGEINVLKEKINSAAGTEEHLNSRKTAISKDIELRNKEKEDIISDRTDSDKEIEKLLKDGEGVRDELKALQDKVKALDENIEAGKNAIIEELNKRSSIKSKIARLENMSEQTNIKKAELNSKLLRAKSDEESREETIKSLEDEFDRITKELRTIKDKEAESEQKLFDFREELRKADEELRKKQELYHQEKSRLDALLNIAERYDGYGGSVKAVMEQKDKNKGIVGVVADIIKVDKKYETAIETALGGNIQNIVTEDEDTAKAMIKHLKDTKAGRATFLPLTSITHPQEFKNPEALKEPGVIGMADEIVKIDKKYANVAKAMLGRIVVVDKVENALRIARKFDYGIRMVTIEGELLVPGGAISGGAFKNNSNLLGRRREIDELKGSVDELREAINEANKQIESIKDNRNRLRTDVETFKNDIQKKTLEQNTARLNLSQTRERLEEESKDMTALKDDVQSIEKEIIELNKEKEDAAKELSLSESAERQTQEKILEFQKELDSKRKEEAEVSAQVSEWDLKIEKIKQARDFKQENIDRIDAEIERFNGELKEVEDALLENAKEVGRNKENIEEIKKNIEASYGDESDANDKLKGDIEKKETLSEKQKNFFKDREKIAEQMSSLDKEVFRLNSQKEKLEEAIESQINYMWDEYEITLSDASALRDETLTDLSGMKKDAASLRNQIKNLGDVNVNAIEDYKVLMERYTFLKKQHDDLVEAAERLKGIIEELDTAMRKQFTEEFAKISNEFDKVFKELFGGGKATLELMEDEDILEAGIKIIAQPPGKKLQNMMQLSGGEKALSAISLLFAIQNLKPSPFCLLDEIEAALDDSNVNRFAKYLHKLTKFTQFIVITHRRGTMEEVDRLYGITMQEKGISKLVSVNLIDSELSD